ncbi:hypothetical protein M0Q28_01040 [Patescibacteria group bacterium]|jgi:hypothetical protein|nr:hypothetical protein [Patescibacteria group bacterium]
MNTPVQAPAPKPGVKNIQLTTTQGCLLLAGLAVFFGGAFLLISMSNSSSVDGRVDITRAGETLALEPFGCMADRVSDELVISLKDVEPKEGFHEENRAIVLNDESAQGETSVARPVEGLIISYRNEDKLVTPMDCTVEQNTLTIRTARRSNAPGRRREDRWNGELNASCKLGDDTYAMKLQMKNCD